MTTSTPLPSSPDAGRPDARRPALVFAPIDGDAAVLAAVIEGEGLRARRCADTRDFYAALREEPQFVAITEEGLALCALDEFTAALRGQALWSNVPLVVLAAADDRQVDSNRFIRLVDMGNVTLLTRPTSRSTLRMAVRSAWRTRLLQFALRDQMAQLASHTDQLESLVSERTSQLEQEVAERRRIEQALAEASRLESLGRLTGGIAHDFNNMLQVVTGSEALLRMLLKANPQAGVTRALDSIRRAAGHGTSLTQQLLAYARRQPLASVDLDLQVHLRITFDMARRMLGPRVEVRLDIAPALWHVVVDPAQLDAALLNIVSNARDAMAPDGALLVTARNRSMPDAALSDGIDLDGDFVEISVTDNGHGMSEDVASHAFDPFFTTKAVGKGTGLGLSQVYGFAIQSAGAAFIRREAAGATVGVLLPRSRRHAAADDAPPPRKSGLADLRVLYVEDDPDVAEITATLLHSMGAGVTRVESADAAMACDFSAIDVVLSDVMMPGKLDGIGLARWLAERHPDLPVVLTSGYVLGPDRLQGLRAGFVRKPASLDELADALLKAVA